MDRPAAAGGAPGGPAKGGMSGAVRTPGLRWDPKTKTAKVTVCIPGTSGKVRRRRTIYAQTRADAVSEWKAFRDEVAARGGRGTVWTLRTYVNAFGPKLKARIGEDGHRRFDFRTGVLARILGERPLHRLTIADAEDLAAEAGKTYAPPTVNGLLATLRKILRDAVKRSELATYPLRGRLPLVREERLRLELSDVERLRFVAAFDDEAGFRRRLARLRVARISDSRQIGYSLPDGDAAGVEFQLFRWHKPVFVVALETGLSRTDLLGLTWRQVDLEGGLIRLTRQKTGVEATIPISAACREALRECRTRPVVGSLVFLGPRGTPSCMVTIRHHFATAKDIAGITRRVRLHDLRHTFASRLASAGVSLQVIAKALGHASTRTTERYARPDADAMKAALEALDAKRDSVTNSEGRGNATK